VTDSRQLKHRPFPPGLLQDIPGPIRDYVYALDHQHIVAASVYPADPASAAPAGARFVGNAADVPGSKANHRESLLGKGGQDQFAFHSRTQDGPRFRVDHFCLEMVLLYVHSTLLETLSGDPRAKDFRYSVIVGHFDKKTVFDFTAHFLRP
jgi:hypothetical protein